MRKIVFFLVCLVIFSGTLFPLGTREVSPSEALELAKKADVYLIDVRTIAEYVYVGHPENAYCLPLLFWDEKKQAQIRNIHFIQDLVSRFKKEDTLVFICRSANRSLVAARMAEDAGFQKIFNVAEGFEGQRDERGYRTIGGWKNRGLPYTYQLNAELLYR